MARPGEQGAGDVMGGDLAILGTLHDQGNVLLAVGHDGGLPADGHPGPGLAEPVPGRNSRRMATSPDTPSTRRVSSVHGSRPAEPTFRRP